MRGVTQNLRSAKREQWIGIAAKRQQQRIVPEEALHAAKTNFPSPAHKAQRQECTPNHSDSGAKREDHVRDIIEPATVEVVCGREGAKVRQASLNSVVKEDCPAAETSTVTALRTSGLRSQAQKLYPSPPF